MNAQFIVDLVKAKGWRIGVFLTELSAFSLRRNAGFRSLSFDTLSLPTVVRLVVQT